MAHRTVHLACLVALLASATSKDQTRWSRQISSYTSDISDWVPLSGPIERESIYPEPLPPIKRQAVAEPRILTEPFPGFTRPTGFSQETFPSRTYFNSPANRQLYLQSVPSAPQNYLTDQGFGQSIRFGLSQPNYPLSQGFVAPQFAYENVPVATPVKPRPQPQLPPNQVKFENFQKQNLPSTQAKPFISQPLRPKPEPPKFVDGYRLENITNDFAYNQKKKPVQSLQKIKFENPKYETISSKPKVEREEVQLLYVPLESLNRGQFNLRPQSDFVNSNLYSQALPKPNPLKQAFSSEVQRPIAKPIDTFSANQDYYSNYEVVNDQVPKYSTISPPFPTAAPTTPKPKKLKPHQPPLAIFMTQDPRKGTQLKVGDVLSSLKTSNTIAVLDTVNPQNAPRVFIGPSSLNPPENFVKFELPYLSNIDNSDKKLRQLPFFVAPLSYNTPNGFAKIPFPSPHVGSVVINSQIKDSNSAPHLTSSVPAANVIPNAYTPVPQEHKVLSTKPNFSYYSTSSPNINAQNNRHQQNYYSIEPQTVTAIPPQKVQELPERNVAPQKTGSYFLNAGSPQYNPTFFPPHKQEYVNQYIPKPETTTTPRTTVSTTTTKPPSSTYPSQLLETHNPYSINQAFHFSTPIDYHNYYDEPYVTPGSSQTPKTSSTPAPLPSNIPQQPAEVVTEKQVYQQQASPNYIQNYNPQIHYESEVSNPRYPAYNTQDAPSKSEAAPETYQSVRQPVLEPQQPIEQPAYNPNQQVITQGTVEYNPTANENLTETIINKITGATDNTDTLKQNQFESSYESEVQHAVSSTSTTTTRRTPIRTRGRPKYTTTPRTDSGESTTSRVSITRRPLRERRPLPSRSRYEPNKITTEKPTRRPLEPVEATTKSTRSRGPPTRGRIHYKPSESDDVVNKRNKGYGKKEQDLAYQRDVLHQNYPVTLMERMSTVDIEAMTEPSINTSEQGGESYDTENAYAHEAASISFLDNTSAKEQQPIYSSEPDSQTESSYVSRFPSTHSEEYIYQTRSSAAPIQAIPSYDEVSEKQEVQKKEAAPEALSYATEQSVQENSDKSDYTTKQEETETSKDIEITKVTSHETQATETEENVIQTTPSYNRVRVRPGVIRQYHQASSTESSKAKSERKKVQAVTYRPAFDRRRTTMRIEEIEADLKTKQIHSRPDFQDYRHPVYKPEPTTEPSVTTVSSIETTTKRGHFRRRRPVYTTTSTEASATKKSNYEVKNRFRGRRPTEKSTEKQESTTETATSTVRNTAHRYRPRLSERYNKRPELNKDAEVSEDQESNYSVNRPKYAPPEDDQWSPKYSVDSFKPYNPNDIIEDSKNIDHKTEEPELDIITANNDYDDILLTVTPASNTRATKKIPDIPPTLEALVEQSKTTKTDSSDSMSTFETMLEEVMKSLEEQDEDEYNNNVMKHKGGEIGEIPPERIISSGEEYNQKTVAQQEPTTPTPSFAETTSIAKEQVEGKGPRRGYWKKVKVRPVATESIEAAESQYYTSTVNRLGDPVSSSKINNDKTSKYDKPKVSVTTYKPNFQFIKDFFEGDEDISDDVFRTMDVPKVGKPTTATKVDSAEEVNEQEEVVEGTTDKGTSPGDLDLGTGSPDPTIMDSMYYSTPTEPTSSESMSYFDRSDGFSLMDYFFGTAPTDNTKTVKNKTEEAESTTLQAASPFKVNTEQIKSKPTTETNYIPDEITTIQTDDGFDTVTDFSDIKRLRESTEEATEYENLRVSTESSYMNPANVISTSMSTEISHETEICFRGKCIKTNKNVL